MEHFELYILNKKFERVCIVDTFESFIWTERYIECGDFELYLSASSNVLPYAVHGYYVMHKHSNKLMIIESTEIETDVEDGNHLKITGRCLKSILSRRIVWHIVTLSGKIQDVIQTLITDAFINPTLEQRKIDNFVFVENDDESLEEFEIEETQYLGDNVYDAVVDILTLFNVGFEIEYDFDANEFVFYIYYGTDRSYNQDINPYVVFSPEFDNIINSNFIEDSSNYKNVNLIVGEEREGKARKFIFVDDETTISGIDRREMFTDGSSISQEYTDENGTEITLSDAEYIETLKQSALEELYSSDNRLSKSFDGEMNTTRGFTYGTDFMLGDVVQLENEYGIKNPARVTEMIFSESTSGIEMYPTFEAINE